MGVQELYVKEYSDKTNQRDNFKGKRRGEQLFLCSQPNSSSIRGWG